MPTPQEYLYHVSEDSAIGAFEPRRSDGRSCGVSGKVVWAIDDRHVANYLFPRDCPRVCYFRPPAIHSPNAERFFSAATISHVVAFESAWTERVLNTPLCIYAFDRAGFQLVDEDAGYYVNTNKVIPSSRKVIVNPLVELQRRGSEIRILPSLWDLREAVIGSGMVYSIIRMRNAGAPANAEMIYHPLP